MTEKRKKYKYPAAVVIVKVLFVLAAICGVITVFGVRAPGYGAIAYLLLAGIPGLALFVAALFGLLVIAIVRASRKEGWQEELMASRAQASSSVPTGRDVPNADLDPENK